MADVRVLDTSYWPAEPGDVHDVTVCETLRHAAATVPDRPALVDCVQDAGARKAWTYAELAADAERVARALLTTFSRGDRIAVWAPNSANWIVLQHGIAMAGMVLVALNPAYRAREMGFVLRQSGAVGLFCPERYRGFDMRGMIEDIRPETPALREVVTFEEWDAFLDRGDPGLVLPEVGPDDVIQIQYTSGTTGFPKGAMLHHKGLVNEARHVAERAGMSDGGVYVNAMPMYHIGGGAVTSFGAWAKRGTFVILPGFEAGLLLEALETYRGTHTLVVPTMLIAMLDHPDRARRDLTSVQTILSGAASVPASLVRKTQKLLNCQFSILFGQTETHGVVSQTRVTDSPEDQAETVGRPLPQLEVKIADEVTGEPVALHETGEICCRGYQNMLGYYRMETETTSTIDADGWLHMGDLGSMDERGFISIRGRMKDMIIRGGLNIYPAEIEGALGDHPAIEYAAVIGVPDARWGEQIGAVVTLREGVERPSVEELTDYLRAEIAPHKTPVYWAFVDQMPATPSGKIQKFVLRERVESGALAFDAVRSASAGPADAAERVSR
ncbi:AMP-binding protein [Amycolatopsis acidiphila]|uniref:AMP-binding protein n=1 Tax=Amycolatopsis acidiphila TaxID=715473 RepID=A0A558AM35_9PSEU|nr:AMP-binding protein [Amycolatopsis acidiphila]TVT25326.1 AMP-binding protein [Amycolatopsis acidiphila]UIJ62452.1 AMP-binding protein [Amycolatopsis acidiphila]GHG83763.1 AMP-binding protein [Amycolatopsis acidiphila]